ncbi:MAG TPA: hypothetical protein VF526_10775 [Solirubrobacteraceae bacterium]
MKQTTKNSRLRAVAATLGIVLALGGTGLALASTTALEPAGISPVIGKSWTTWVPQDEPSYGPLPTTPPTYSQVNFLSNPYATGGPIKTAQGAGQMHAEATVQLRKGGGGDARVFCDVRIDGSDGSYTYETTIRGSDTQVTIPLVGHKPNLAAGDHNAGVRCWAMGEQVYMNAVDLHAVIYGASVPS